MHSRSYVSSLWLSGIPLRLSLILKIKAILTAPLFEQFIGSIADL
jgi:hypothetical protein